MRKMRKFEYKIEEIRYPIAEDRNELKKKLDMFGEKGWEVYQIENVAGNALWIWMKKEK